MKQSSTCIQVVANQAGIPFSKAEAILRQIADWSTCADIAAAFAIAQINGARFVLETLGVHAGAINRAVAAINGEEK